MSQSDCDVVEDERDELNFARLGGFARGALGAAYGGCTRRGGVEKRRDQVALEDETQDEQHQESADAEWNAATADSKASATAAVAAIFDVAADAARSPAHESPQEGSTNLCKSIRDEASWAEQMVRGRIVRV